jgi:transcriptional regulator with XRE-family HTH domain
MPTTLTASAPTASAPAKRRASTTFLQVLPRRIVQYRELRGVSKAALARAAGVSVSTLKSIESGQAKDMKLSTLEKMCHALGVSADALCGFNDVLLVRNPERHGLIARDDPTLINPARACQHCGTHIRARAVHLPGSCMMVMFDRHTSPQRIGDVFGLSEQAILAVLREEHTVRSRRRLA